MQRIGSDVDLLIVASFEGNRAQHLRRARHLAANCFPPADIVFATPEEVAGPATAASPFLASILEGSRYTLGVLEEVPRLRVLRQL
jgi:hypothetical protein